MSVEMTDTFCSFYKKCHFCHLRPFAKLGQYSIVGGEPEGRYRCSQHNVFVYRERPSGSQLTV